MSLLALEHVSVRRREGRRETMVLDGVTLTLEAGELVMVYGLRRAGKSTLLRVAAGIQRPEQGSVCFDGRDLAGDGRGALGHGIGYVAKALRGGEEQDVLAHVAAPLLARGVAVGQARDAAREALSHAGAGDALAARVSELSGAQSLRVALARDASDAPARDRGRRARRRRRARRARRDPRAACGRWPPRGPRCSRAPASPRSSRAPTAR